MVLQNLENCDEIKKKSGRFYDDPLGYAMFKFAYYRCYKCQVLHIYIIYMYIFESVKLF